MKNNDEATDRNRIISNIKKIYETTCFNFAKKL